MVKQERKLVLSKCYIGVEIEIEGAYSITGKQPFWWDVKRDGSLREGGIELVFRRPLYGNNVVEALNEAYDTLLSKNMKVSPRTGIHVHLDVRNFGQRDIRVLCVLYALVEEPLFKWVGNHREINSFCLPWYEAEGDIDTISKMVSKDASSIKRIAGQLHRYSALNLNAISKFGSVEFRHLQTTLDKEKVFTWINLILSMKKFVKDYPGDAVSLLDLYKSIGGRKFLKKVFGKYSSELDHSCINLGLTQAQEVCQGEKAVEDRSFYAHLFKKGKPEGYDKFVTKHLSKY